MQTSFETVLKELFSFSGYLLVTHYTCLTHAFFKSGEPLTHVAYDDPWHGGRRTQNNRGAVSGEQLQTSSAAKSMHPYGLYIMKQVMPHWASNFGQSSATMYYYYCVLLLLLLLLLLSLSLSLPALSAVSLHTYHYTYGHNQVALDK